MKICSSAHYMYNKRKNNISAGTVSSFIDMGPNERNNEPIKILYEEDIESAIINLIMNIVFQ